MSADTPVALEAAYRAAVYELFTPAGAITLRIGERPAQDGQLPTPPLAVITAYNPGSIETRPGENQASQAELRELVRSSGCDSLPAQNRAPDGSHREPSLAILGISQEAARTLAANFGQAAFVYWNGGTVELVWVSDAN